MAQQSEVKAWEEEIESCKHSKELVQEASKQLEQSGRPNYQLVLPVSEP
jgi:hypothetical protein